MPAPAPDPVPSPASGPRPSRPGAALGGNPLRALRYRNFRLFFFGQGISLIGTWMQQVAMSWMVYRLTGSAWKLGLVGFAGQIPMLLLSPVAGVYADRWNRHSIMLFTQILSMLQAFAVTALVMTGKVAIWQIIPLNFFIGCVNAFDMPARQAYFISMIGRREDLGNAIALNSSIVNGARLIGPPIAGSLIATLGEGPCFLLNALSYLAVIWALLAMDRIPFQSRGGDTPVLQHLAEGLRYAFGFPPMRAILLLLALVSLVGVPYVVLMPVIVRVHLHGNAHTLGWLHGAAGLGAFLGAIFLTARKSVLGLGRVMTMSTSMFGAALIAFALSRWLPLSMFFLVAVGFGMIATLAAANTVLQTLVEDRMRGRVMSLYAMAFMGMVPFGSLLAGTLGERLGAPHTLMIGGIVCLIGGIIFGIRLSGLREQARPIYQEKGILPEQTPPPMAQSSGEQG